MEIITINKVFGDPLKTSIGYLVEKRFCFTVRDNFLVIYDVLENKEIKLFEISSETKYENNDCVKYVHSKIDYIDGFIMLYNKNDTSMFKLTDNDEEIDSTKRNECVICFAKISMFV